ncbi:hypothetical protein [Magnetospirillum sp. SS-4]|uniref:hypothetical protein n=1 Tax=Magnetospirillum sp. SS-4 TaxID=2681465 RepID=UPI00137EE6BC|nr:hypothetical protein [Magnetospirillum sp. SS-4]CAA7622105.1 hypothetical protein MTBSS4_320027 [Magnetospirillum sp. SS-4]
MFTRSARQDSKIPHDGMHEFRIRALSGRGIASGELRARLTRCPAEAEMSASS